MKRSIVELRVYPDVPEESTILNIGQARHALTWQIVVDGEPGLIDFTDCLHEALEKMGLIIASDGQIRESRAHALKPEIVLEPTPEDEKRWVDEEWDSRNPEPEPVSAAPTHKREPDESHRFLSTLADTDA